MVGFQEVIEIWGVYWFGRCLGSGWQEFLFGKVAKGRLKMGFRRPFWGKGLWFKKTAHPAHKIPSLRAW